MRLVEQVGAHPGRQDRNRPLLQEAEEGGPCAGRANAVAGQEQGTLGAIDKLDGLRDLGLQVAPCRRLGDFAGIEAGEVLGIDRRRLHVQRDVDPDGSLSSASGQMHGLFQVVADRGRIRHRHRVLGDRLHDGDDVHFLGAELPYAQVAPSGRRA